MIRRFFAATAAGTLALLTAVAPVSAQTVEDGKMVPKRTLGAGLVFSHESWDRYWEGTLNRGNDNIGRFTTANVTLVAGYGFSDRLSVLAMLPYVQNRTSFGVLQEMEGFQDVLVAAKYNLFTAPVGDLGNLRAIAVASVGSPVSDYTPDFLPLSIGLGARRAAGRLTAHFQAEDGWFLTASGAYTWRGNVELDRAAYYTDGELFLTSEVDMPNVVDYSVAGGFRKGRFHLPISVSEQRTLGGGDIRRQDMPFVSNRMNFVRVDGAIAYAAPAPCLNLRIGGGRVLSGRNVGEATTLSAGLLCTFSL